VIIIGLKTRLSSTSVGPRRKRSTTTP